MEGGRQRREKISCELQLMTLFPLQALSTYIYGTFAYSVTLNRTGF